MLRTRKRADIEYVGPAAAITTAEERVQRTERRLIEAALALVDADRISVAEWDEEFREGTVIAEAGELGGLGGRLPSTDETRAPLVNGEPHILTAEHTKLM